MSKTFSEMSSMIPTWPRVRVLRAVLKVTPQRYPLGGSQHALWRRLIEAGLLESDGQCYRVTDLGKDWLARVSHSFPEGVRKVAP